MLELVSALRYRPARYAATRRPGVTPRKWTRINATADAKTDRRGGARGVRAFFRAMRHAGRRGAPAGNDRADTDDLLRGRGASLGYPRWPAHPLDATPGSVVGWAKAVRPCPPPAKT